MDFVLPEWETEVRFSPCLTQQPLGSSQIRWVTLDGRPSQETRFELERLRKLYANPQPLPLEDLVFRAPNDFQAGGIHNHVPAWLTMVAGQSNKTLILRWLEEGVHVKDFATRFTGSFRRRRYDGEFPPPYTFQNLQNCKNFKEFISATILQRIASGAVRVWGKVEDTKPPYLVHPLTVEPSKPRLCLDARFINLWMKDCPFSLDRVTDVKNYVYRNSFMTKCDDKSGYDHVRISEESTQYFGFEWAGW